MPEHAPRVSEAASICCIAPGQCAHHMRIYHKICRSLAYAGYPVTLIAHDDEESDDGLVCIWRLGSSYRNYFNLNVFNRFRRSAEAFRLALQSNASVYFYHSPEFIPWAVLLQLWTGRPVIFDCMEDFEGYASERQGLSAAVRWLIRMATRAMLWLSAKTADVVILSDVGTEEYFKAFGATTLVVRNFPQLELFPVGGGEKTYDLVYHGTLRASQIAQFLEIDDWLARNGRQLQWYLFGHMLWLDRLRQDLIRRGSIQRFHLGHPIPHEKIGLEIARARIGIIPLPNMPKYHNNIPMKLFEYMAVGIPVVLSDLPPSQEFVENNRTAIMVEPTDYAGFGRAIDWLLKNPEVCADMGARSRQAVEREYNWARESEKLLVLIRRLAARPGTEPADSRATSRS